MWSDNETSEDLLGFKIHADLLIDVVSDNRVLPVTIGVFGDWGSGKSSILKIINDELAGQDGELKNETLVLYFNGWVFEGYDDAKAALLESIIEKFEKHKTLGNKVKDSAAKLIKSVHWMRILGFGFKKIVVPTATAYFTGGLSLVPFLSNEFSKIDKKELAEKLTGDKAGEFLKEIILKKEEEKNTLVREFREDFETMIEKSGIKKLVVIIDDLDRCTNERIIENLEAIKLFLNVKNTAFIIGADPRIVRQAIEFRYKTDGIVKDLEEDGDTRIVDDYLEKLIQIPYYLPKLSEPEVETYISMLICKKELDEENFNKVLLAFYAFREKDRYSTFGLANLETIIDATEVEKIKRNVITIPALVPIIAQSLYGNPRQIKRFLNTYTLRRRLADVASLNDFNHSILAKLMVLEYTELKLFRQLFNWQMAQSGLPNEIKFLEEACCDKKPEDSKNEIQGLYQNWTKDKVIRWLSVEPKLTSIDLRDYFWISRDKLSTSIAGTSLISPTVKALFKELENELPATLTKKIITDKIPLLLDYERTSLLELLSQMLKKNPKTKRLYDIFNYLIDEKIPDAATYYMESLKAISTSDIEPGVGVSLSTYHAHPEFGDFLSKYFEKNNTPGAKAFNRQKAK